MAHRVRQLQRGIEVVPVAVDERLAPHVPSQLAHELAGHVAVRVDPRLATVRRGGSGARTLLKVHEAVAHARRDAARPEQGGEQHGVLATVTAAGARRLGRGCVGGLVVLVSDVRVHELAQAQRDGLLQRHRLAQGHGPAVAEVAPRLVVPLEEATSRAHLLEATVDGVGELDDLLVDAIHHGRGRHVLRVASLLLGGRHRVGQVDGDEELLRVLVDHSHTLVARCR
mmetsp:Transcript_27344/g.64564  ORF Transcript_27344/g.64564 Transcript_27344/m.64564 type:complete len:227 (-) Transcript_27344:1307-1987(-)